MCKVKHLSTSCPKYGAVGSVRGSAMCLLHKEVRVHASNWGFRGLRGKRYCTSPILSISAPLSTAGSSVQGLFPMMCLLTLAGALLFAHYPFQFPRTGR